MTGGPNGGGKITFGELLAICGIDREPVDKRFLSSIRVGLLPVNLASFGVGRFALSMKHEGVLEKWHWAPVKKNWYGLPKRVSLFQRAQKWKETMAIQKTSRLDALARLRGKFVSETSLR